MLKTMKWTAAALVGASLATYGCQSDPNPSASESRAMRTSVNGSAAASAEPYYETDRMNPETRVLGETVTRDHQTYDTDPLRVAIADEDRFDLDGVDAGPDSPIDPNRLPAYVRDAALREVPGGRIVAAEYYVSSNTGVFNVAVNAADGRHDLKIREKDAVVLLNHRTPS